jgi:hypothetical protein
MNILLYKNLGTLTQPYSNNTSFTAVFRCDWTVTYKNTLRNASVTYVTKSKRIAEISSIFIAFNIEVSVVRMG